MKQIFKIFHTIYCIYAFVLFGLLLLVLMPFFFIASLFGKVNGGNLIYKFCSLWADIWLPLIGIKAKVIHEHPLQEKRPCVFVANHISYMDIPMVVKTVREPIRPLGKAEMSKIPLFGYMYKNVVVMVDRTSAENRIKSVQQLQWMLDKGISVFIFPEGTFNETTNHLKSFYDGAFRIAINTQTPIQPVIFPDTVYRLHNSSVFSLSPGKSRAVYLDMIEVKDYVIEDLPTLKQHVYEIMENALVKYRGVEELGIRN